MAKISDFARAAAREQSKADREQQVAAECRVETFTC
jgi:hypothetical protein